MRDLRCVMCKENEETTLSKGMENLCDKWVGVSSV